MRFDAGFAEGAILDFLTGEHIPFLIRLKANAGKPPVWFDERGAETDAFRAVPRLYKTPFVKSSILPPPQLCGRMPHLTRLRIIPASAKPIAAKTIGLSLSVV